VKATTELPLIVGLPLIGSPSLVTSAPSPVAGLFGGSPVQPTVRLGVGVAGLLITFVERSTSAETRAGQARFCG
jgi:hypothetical protein